MQTREAARDPGVNTPSYKINPLEKKMDFGNRNERNNPLSDVLAASG